MLRAPRQIFQGDPGSGGSAHPVDAAAGRCRGGAQIDGLERAAVGNAGADGPREELPEVHRTGVDVSADQLAVVALDLGRPPGASGQDRLAEARCEALDLRLDRVAVVL